ncbi:MAG TPA: ANTAR domain-containing protein [Tepidisphaeraceae bacterium]|jgi:response regulator NasT|nr:ANTAR domain-containing protein [Tepidisphaeraceae bacterium]
MLLESGTIVERDVTQSPENLSAARRVLIVENETLFGMGLRSQLERIGHTVVGQAATAADAMIMHHERQPDLLLIDIRLGSDDGVIVAEQLLKMRRVPALIVSAFSDKALVDRAAAAGVFGYLIKPPTTESLQAQITVAVRRQHEQEQLIQQNRALSETLETRKLVEKAKGILMRRLKLDEPEAHKRLQQESQKRRKSLPELAKGIIESEEIAGS